MDALSAIHDNACDMRQRLEFYLTNNNSNIGVDEKWVEVMTQELWKIMRTFDYETMEDKWGDWTGSQNVSVREKLKTWQAFAQQETFPDMEVADLILLIEDVWQLHHQLFSLADEDLQDMIVKAYKEYEGQK